MSARNPLDESEFENNIIHHLVHDQGYIERKAAASFDPVRAMDVDLLFRFLDRTQPKTMKALHDLHGGAYRDIILATVFRHITEHGLLAAIRDGVPFDAGLTLDLIYPRPSARFDAASAALYEANILSVMKEVYPKPGERIDLVIFLNGLALFTIELKCPSSATGWDWREAIRQYREDRDCTSRLLMPRIGALAHFAMDTNEVHVCTELKGRESRFLPFNQGVRSGGQTLETLPGNPPRNDTYATAYMHEDILSRNTISDLIHDFIYLAHDRKRRNRTRLIFPRYQQLRAVRRVTADMAAHGTTRNYLIEHSAGSGKTNTICWLAHHLSKLYATGEDKPLLSKVLIVTDRIVVDEQLQHAVMDMARDPAVIKIITDGAGGTDEYGESSKSGKLGKALAGSYRIVVCTMATFLHASTGMFDGTGERFAVIIDEAHSSTSGSIMKSIGETLADGQEAPTRSDAFSPLDMVAARLPREHGGRQWRNVSIIGFTATPTAHSLQLFGTTGAGGRKEAFDLYSMRQAIAEKFILDVTANYTTYNSYCRVVKDSQDDPELDSGSAKRQIAHIVANADGTIEGNLNVIIDHFLMTVAAGLGGKAKAMIVTAGREEAVRYKLAYDKLRASHMGRLGRIQALVAFSDEIEVDGESYTERAMNGGLAEDKLPEVFAQNDYRLLIVADKYQTGFDEPYLSAMYVIKRLHGIAAVQTLSRLNRICPPYEKRTYVIDFVNNYDTIREAFAPYYESTILEKPLTLAMLRNTERMLAELNVLDVDDVREFYGLIRKERPGVRQQERMWALLDAAARVVLAMDEEAADKARAVIRAYVRQYGFLSMCVPIEDEYMYMEYRFCMFLMREITTGDDSDEGLDIRDRIRLEDFRVEKDTEHVDEGIEAGPEVVMPLGAGGSKRDQRKETLSRILDEWNAKYGKRFDEGTVENARDQLESALSGNGRVRESAKANDMHGFDKTVHEETYETLTNNYADNMEFYKFLFKEKGAVDDLIGMFLGDLYRKLRGDSDGGGDM